MCFVFFFFNDTATTEIYTLSLHDALPISIAARDPPAPWKLRGKIADAFGKFLRRIRVAEIDTGELKSAGHEMQDRKSTRLNSSHSQISYAVFCLKKQNQNSAITRRIISTP